MHHRGAVGDTVLEEDVRIDSLCQIGHSVQIGPTAIAGYSGVRQHPHRPFCLLGGRSGVTGHVEVADRTTIAAGSDLYKGVAQSGQTWSGQFPAQPIREWQRNLARLRQLEDLARRVRRIEKQQGKSPDDD
jgi:UDP-3-O-[3-hydroxymyristoyl] glucosamine N-acyltransferase